MIEMHADGVNDALTFVNKVAKEIKTSRALEEASRSAANTMTQEFNMFADVAARSEDALSHVYEWGQVGLSGGRLWTTEMTGRKGGRTLTFNFMPSKVPVPIPEREPGPNGEQIQGGHIFTWKAMVMEYGMPTVVKRQGDSKLAFPVPGEGFRNGLVFLQGPIRLDNRNHHNFAFTGLWTGWWSGSGPDSIFEERVRPELEKPWARAERDIKPSRSMKKTLTFSVNSSAGNRQAINFLNKLSIRYGRM